MKKVIYIGIVAVVLILIFLFVGLRGDKSFGVGEIFVGNTEKQIQRLVFVHATLGFSFDYPSSHNLSIVEDGFGESILVLRDGRGMQVYISEVDSSVKVDSNTVRRDLVGEKIESLLDIELPKEKISAVSFASEHDTMGRVWDVWFSHEGVLYQVTCEEGEEELLKMFVESFSF